MGIKAGKLPLRPLFMNQDELYMHRCLQLAALGMRQVAPNPMVGALLVHKQKVISEGYHEFFGAPHAEVMAINAVKDDSILPECTLYVNLEPCNHFGKTPPCSTLIAEKKIPKVVIAHSDPFPRVNGSGISYLQANGVDVITGVLENEARFLNRRFIVFHERKRPYIILKWAVSADGYLGLPGKNVRISNEETRILTHQWRSQEPAILIGGGTAVNDDPVLDTRFWPGINPLRVILDHRGSLPSRLKILDGTQPTLIITTHEGKTFPNAGVHVTGSDAPFLQQALHHLYEKEIQSVLVEGGALTLNEFIRTGNWDEIRVFQSDMLLGEGIKAPALPLDEPIISQTGDNKLLVYFNRIA